jgi:hypothetical protein
MKSFRLLGMSAMFAAVLGALGPRAEAQQFYGFRASPDQLATLLASLATAQTPPGCAPLLPKFGCDITPTTPPTLTCPPDLLPVTQQICIILCDQKPPGPVDLTITKNVFLPVVIKNNTPPNVLPVNIKVQWQPIHFLANEKGQPIDQAGNVLPNDPKVVPPAPAGVNPSSHSGVAAPSPQSSNAATAPGTALASTAAGPGTAPVSTAVVSTQPVAPAPAPTTTAPGTTASAAPATVQANAPTKQWVWLSYEGVYGYGYQRADGYWIIDEGSRTKTLPTASTAPAAAPTTTASTSTPTTSVN